MSKEQDLQEVFARKYNVSRETFLQLSEFVELTKKYQPKINLISNSTLPHIWERHVEDSLQLVNFVPRETDVILDMGSGAGYPAIILAMMLKVKTFAIESDMRKSIFLQEVKMKLGLANLEVANQRVENLSLPFDEQQKVTFTARAFASLTDIFGYAHKLVIKHNMLYPTLVLPKGRNANIEIEEAQKTWAFDIQTSASLVDTESVILTVTNLRKAK